LEIRTTSAGRREREREREREAAASNNSGSTHKKRRIGKKRNRTGLLLLLEAPG
jgi:hypothetical protein